MSAQRGGLKKGIQGSTVYNKWVSSRGEKGPADVTKKNREELID